MRKSTKIKIIAFMIYICSWALWLLEDGLVDKYMPLFFVSWFAWCMTLMLK